MSNRRNLERALKCFADPQKREEYFELYSDDIALYGYGGVEGPWLEQCEAVLQGLLEEEFRWRQKSWVRAMER